MFHIRDTSFGIYPSYRDEVIGIIKRRPVFILTHEFFQFLVTHDGELL